MTAYFLKRFDAFAGFEPCTIIGALQSAYASDGFASQYTKQTITWGHVIAILQRQIAELICLRPDSCHWHILLEYPLYRLRRRIDVVILTEATIIVVECKIGAKGFSAADERQVEEYALDLRDFHAASRDRPIVPILWSSDAEFASVDYPSPRSPTSLVAETVNIGSEGLLQYFLALPVTALGTTIVAEEWDTSPYKPVPNVIEAATSIFSGHDVRSIANGDADNLRIAAARLVELIEEARTKRRRYLLILTGVPGSGKTLAGLHVVHSAITTGIENNGDIVYLSGNTPLVTVLREALARDEDRRQSTSAAAKRSLKDIRRDVRARIQHINDFLRDNIKTEGSCAPHEHVIVFDEAQRAWDEKQGKEKFDRTASEPELLLELMAKHADWCACVCLVGGGQEINSGEEGVFGWGEALRKLKPNQRSTWRVFAPPDVIDGGPSAGTFRLGSLPAEITCGTETELQLRVPQRSYRSPDLCRWVDQVLGAQVEDAYATALKLGQYPIILTRSLSEAKTWLREQGRGERRYGLVASSGARRLRADGVGALLHASAGEEIAHWYLNRPGDIRSSYALEVPANEYTCQGLELDFVGVCWGGDLLWDEAKGIWAPHRLAGANWQKIKNHSARRFLENSYRVLLTRAREGLVVWVPDGDDADHTRLRAPLDATASLLVRCGARYILNS